MTPRFSQNTTKKPARKTKSSSSKFAIRKLDSLPLAQTSPIKRINPLTAFSNLPVIDVDALPSPPRKSTKGKAKENRTSLPVSSHSENETQLWVDRYEPITEADLAVHKRKVEDVRHWLMEALDGGPSGVLRKYRRILVLTGPAGTGKTATIHILSREMGFDILEWRSSAEEQFSTNFGQVAGTENYTPSEDYESIFAKFQTFLTRATACRNIFTAQSQRPLLSQTTCSQSSSSSRVIPPESRRQIILLEDLPNVLHPRIQSQFHESLLSFVQTPSSSPLVIVISDASLRGEASDHRIASGSGWSHDQDNVVDIRTVLPRELLGCSYVMQIRFNPIAPTLMRKALQAMLNTHLSSLPCSHSGTMTVPPSKEFLDMIIESANGDIRSAVMALQFACVMEVPGSAKGKGTSRNARVLLEAVSRREQTLVLFHLMGKVLYNKRKGDPPNPSASAKDIQKENQLDTKLKDPPILPEFLQKHDRRASRVDVDDLYADSPIDSSLYSLYLHQNYSQFANDVDGCADIADWLSWVDSSGGDAWYQANPYQFHLLTLATLHSLPSPVTRRSQKIYKPEFFEALKHEKEAWDAVRDVQQWLLERQRGGQDRSTHGMGGCRKLEIILELGAVLKIRSTMDHPPPASHNDFSRMVFSYGGSDMQILGEDASVIDREEAREDHIGGGSPTEDHPEEANGGWLESDDIEEF